MRPGGGGEFQPPAPALRYFVNVIPTGGHRMSRFRDTKLYYTANTINPMVLVRNDDGGWHSRLCWRILRREAEALIQPAQSPKP